MPKRIGMFIGNYNHGRGCTTCGNNEGNKLPLRTVGGMIRQASAQRRYLDNVYAKATKQHKSAVEERRTITQLQSYERAERERAERERAERERVERERAERERVERVKAAQAKAARDAQVKAAQDARVKAERERVERTKAEQAARMHERAAKAKNAQQKSNNKAIHVYGAEWCGFTRKQNAEIKEALKGDPNAAQKYVYIDCVKDKTHHVCKEMKAFPLTVVHERNKHYTLDQLTKINQPGYRPGNVVVDELNGKAPAPAPPRPAPAPPRPAPAPPRPAPAPPRPAPAPPRPAPAPPRPAEKPAPDGSPAIHVYGAEWCGFTKRQNNEIREALAKEAQGGNAHVYIDCAGEGKNNRVCSGMPGYPLTVVHERGKQYSLEELMKIKQPGYRPGATVVAEWKEACGKAPPKNNVQFEINSSGEKRDKAIHVYGANWCGFTRSQISELKDTLKHEAGGLESLQVHECTDQNLGTEAKQICGGLQGYPFTVIGDKVAPKEPVAELLKKFRMGKRPAAEVVGEWKKACGDNSQVKVPDKQGGCISCGDK